MAFRIFKQLLPSPTSSVDRNGETWTDPEWASREIYVAKLSGSGEQIWEYSGSDAQADATTKMNALTGSDASGRIYKVMEV